MSVDAAEPRVSARDAHRSHALTWAVVLIAVGAVLRLHQYLLGRSLYVDEAALALNLLDRSWGGLWEPLAYEQAAPIGFLLLEKLFIEQLGASEYVLRLLPLLAGLISLILFHRLVVRTLHPFGAMTALAAFALSGGLIYFAADLKPYALDVAVAVGIYLAALRLGDRGEGTLLLGLVGAAAVWLSYPALFVLAAVGLTLGVEALRRGNRNLVGRLVGVAGAWLGSFAVMYFATLSESATVSDMQFFWSRDGRFMPLPPTSAEDIRWFYETFFALFRRPIGLPLAGLAALGFLSGVVSLWNRDRRLLAMLLGPILLTLFASGFQLYPFHGRVLLFLTPAVLLLIGEGAAHVYLGLRSKPPVVPVLLVGLLLFHPTQTAAINLLKSQNYEMMPLRDLRGVMAQIRTDADGAAPVYVYYAADRVFEYYGPRMGFGAEQVYWGSSPGRKGTYAVADLEALFMKDLGALSRHERLWFVFTNSRRTNGVDEEAYLLELAERELGVRALRTHRARGAVGYLYAREAVTRQ